MDYFLITTSLLKIVGILFVVILPMVAYSIYAERRVSALIQDRPGPNRVGPAGLFQPVADIAKLLFKEDFTPRNVNTFYYWLAPCLAMVPAIITIAVVPFGSTLLRRSHGHRGHQRRNPLRFCHRLAWCLRNRPGRLGFQFKVSVSRRRSFQFANDFLRTLARSRRHSDFPGRRPAAPDRSRSLSNRTRLDDRAIPRRLDESRQMAPDDSDACLVRRLHDRAFRGDESTALRFARSGTGTGRRLSHRIQLDEVRALSFWANTPP